MNSLMPTPSPASAMPGTSPQVVPGNPSPKYELASRIRALFLAGKDTADIAKVVKLSESQVSRLLWVARCREKNAPAHFLDKNRNLKVISQ